MIFLAVSLLACATVLPSCRLIGTALGLGMVKLQFGCLPQGTRIDTPEGPVRIETLKTGDTVIGFTGSRVKVSQIHQYQEDPATSRYLTIHFADNSQVSLSLKHRIDGIPAKDLKLGDTCGSHVVTRIENRKGVSRSFDLLTSDSGYRISGIPVNSMIEEMMRR